MECYMHHTLHRLHVVCCGAFRPAHSVIFCSCMTVTSTCVQYNGEILQTKISHIVQNKNFCSYNFAIC